MLDGSSRSVGKVQLKSDFAEYQSHDIKRAKTPNVVLLRSIKDAIRTGAEAGSVSADSVFSLFCTKRPVSIHTRFSRIFALFLCFFLKNYIIIVNKP